MVSEILDFSSLDLMIIIINFGHALSGAATGL